jgi:hypothetical protein
VAEISVIDQNGYEASGVANTSSATTAATTIDLGGRSNKEKNQP